MDAHPSLVNRPVIVTGGSRGIGREITLALLEAGARVAIGATKASSHLEQTLKAAEAIAGTNRVLPVFGDIRLLTDCARMARETLDAFGAIHVLFNNAAIAMPVSVDTGSRPPPFWKAEPETWDAMVDTNINGVFRMTRSVMPAMLDGGFGKIINLSSNDRTMVRPRGSPYGPTKAFVEAASRIWAQDLAGTGVTVNVLAPGGAIDTSRSLWCGRRPSGWRRISRTGTAASALLENCGMRSCRYPSASRRHGRAEVHRPGSCKRSRRLIGMRPMAVAHFDVGLLSSRN